VDDDVHEVERNLSLGRACGYVLPDGDAGGLRVDVPQEAGDLIGLPERFVVVHPGASVPARTWTPSGFAELVAALEAAGRCVVVTGGPTERPLTASVAAGCGPGVVDLGGRLDLATLARVIERADAVVVGNTGPAHLAAAVGTPVVSLYAPTVPAARWRPWGVPHVVLGDQDIACRGCRARSCPVPGQPCLGGLTVAGIGAAIDRLVGPPTVAVGSGAHPVGVVS
jgi:ADP-heptose:LPS heptosyltransferase